METINIRLPIDELLTVAAEELVIEKAVELARAILADDNCKLIECQRVTKSLLPLFSSGDEIIIFETAVDVSQNVVYDIRYVEQLCVQFYAGSDSMIPLVYALRKDFPIVPHRIALSFEKPACLCIYEEHYQELKLTWRSPKFLADIRSWLSRTATGKLHEDDQALEPLLLFSGGTIIIPSDLESTDSVSVHLTFEQNGRLNLIAQKDMSSNFQAKVLTLSGSQQAQAGIQKTPGNLFELANFVEEAGLDLHDAVKNYIINYLDDDTSLQSRLLLLIVLPKVNQDATRVENDIYAFLTSQTISEIGISLDLWTAAPDGGLGRLLMPQNSREKMSIIKLEVLLPYRHLTLDSAITLSNCTRPTTEPRITQIGVGALGSQLWMNLARTGFGRWTAIDNDILLPHNTVRHLLPACLVGFPKVQGLAELAKSMFSERFFEGICKDVLAENQSLEIDNYLRGSDLILDTSASLAVARELSCREIGTRIVSCFLNPKGTDLVILAEGKDRSITLDELEFQYYRAIIKNSSLSGHLTNADSIRFSNSCRDISSLISSDYVTLLSSIGAAMVRKINESEKSLISIWRICDEDLQVMRVNVVPAQIQRKSFGDWTVIFDGDFCKQINDLRKSKLPSETGGILLGGYDFQSKKIYIIEACPAPPDSEGTSSTFQRGVIGIKEQLLYANAATHGHIVYIGEWHSHPDDCSVKMSRFDMVQLDEISMQMEVLGLPAVQLIVGQKGQIAINIKDKGLIIK